MIDARDVPREVIDPPVQDFDTVRQALDALPAPSGSSDLPAAATRAVQVLSRTSNLAREVIVLTDRQRVPWDRADNSAWRRFDDLLTQPNVRPRVWVVDVANDPGERVNFALAEPELSRDLSVPDFPVRVQSVVRSYGGARQQTRRVHLEVNGQRITEKTISCTVPTDGEAPVEFEVKLPSTGSWLLSIVLDSDELPGDNRADAAITVAEAVPVLIVDGSWSPDATRRESFFAQAALSASENDRPWVLSRAVSAAEFAAADLREAKVVFLADVPRLTEAQAAALMDFVARGGGLFISVGGKTQADVWNRQLYGEGRSLLPAELLTVEQDQAAELGGVRVVDSSLQLPWVRRFRAEHDGGFTEARFSKWWRVFPASATAAGAEEAAGPTAPVSDPIVVARLNTGDPLLVARQYGKGRVMLMAAPLDADWGTLPTRPDFVAFLHEVTFNLASAEVNRNVRVATPLVQPISPEQRAEDFEFVGPGDLRFPALPGGDELQPAVQLSDTRLPGIYELRPKGQNARERGQYFVVNGDRRESDLAPLDDEAIAGMEGDGRLTFVEDVQDLKRQMFEQESPTELWPMLLLVFVGFMICELLLTRRLVRGGHAPVQQQQTSPPDDVLPVDDEPSDDSKELEDEVHEYEMA